MAKAKQYTNREDYQVRHKEAGLCRLCPLKVFKWDLCRKHYKKAYQVYWDNKKNGKK